VVQSSLDGVPDRPTGPGRAAGRLVAARSLFAHRTPGAPTASQLGRYCCS